ncbi:hypothetical protein OPV22_012934 [Ensete ventricosum]|uniref:Uncharacterized protein n=1 Tax=Ensete ventricosum TaxID=4639 RepID=A0AAV8PI09_ENSVE|nr:hypothetical protein OPV22_012934 [Ensete ventricosum]
MNPEDTPRHPPDLLLASESDPQNHQFEFSPLCHLASSFSHDQKVVIGARFWFRLRSSRMCSFMTWFSSPMGGSDQLLFVVPSEFNSSY